MADPDNRRTWHFDKTIGVAHVFTTIAAIAAVVIVGSNWNTRLSLVEQAVVVQHSTEARQDQDVAEFKRELRANVQAINDKLDRLIERRR